MFSGDRDTVIVLSGESVGSLLLPNQTDATRENEFGLL